MPCAGRVAAAEVAGERSLGGDGMGGGQVIRKRVEERGDIGGTLHVIGVAAEGDDAAARPAEVAQQQLHDGSRTDDLRTGAVLRPAESIGDGAGAFTPRVEAE